MCLWRSCHGVLDVCRELWQRRIAANDVKQLLCLVRFLRPDGGYDANQQRSLAVVFIQQPLLCDLPSLICSLVVDARAAVDLAYSAGRALATLESSLIEEIVISGGMVEGKTLDLRCLHARQAKEAFAFRVGIEASEGRLRAGMSGCGASRRGDIYHLLIRTCLASGAGVCT